jgi:hypothetical protein
MRFISKWGRFGVQIRPQLQEAYATGMARVIQEPVYAMFYPGKLTPDERQMAVTHWTFNGFYQEQDEVTVVAPDYRIGCFDSREAQIESGWSDELRIEVENELVRLAGLYDDVMVVPEITLSPPWPRYDEFKGGPKVLVRKLIEEGYDLEEVLAYERQSQNRELVVEELERELAGGVREEEVVG